MATIRSPNGVKCLQLLMENGVDQSIVDSVLLPSWLDIRSDSLFQDSCTAYDRAEDAKNNLIKNLLDPQFSRLGLMATTICLNDIEKFIFLLQKRDFGKRINDRFPFSISLHQQFLGTPEAHDNGSHLWSEVTTLLRCAAFLNRVDCLVVLKDKGANMVSVLLFLFPFSCNSESYPQADMGAYVFANDATKTAPDLFDVRTMLRCLHFGDTGLLQLLLTHHPYLVNETDEKVKTFLLGPSLVDHSTGRHSSSPSCAK
jgi:hypothetical protein